MKLLIYLLFTTLYLVSKTVAVNADLKATTDTIQKAWKLDTKEFTIDPTAWSTDFTGRMMKIAVGVSAAYTFGLSLSLTLLYGVFLFGLVKLNWLLVITTVCAVYGWLKKQPLYMLGGGMLSYLLAFGQTFV